MKSLIDYAKEELNAVSLKKVVGPNGAFISVTNAEGETSTLPVGGKSQAGKLAEFNILITDDGQAIATVNHYEEEESLELA